MLITQDDLRLLHHLRAVWVGGSAAIAAREALAVAPGRAEGRVAAWAMNRTASLLEVASRRPLTIGQGLAPSLSERQILKVARALSEGDWAEAEEAALWLVRRDAVPALLDTLAPAACALYGKRSFRRQAAKTA